MTPASLAPALAFLVSGCNGATPASEGVGGALVNGTGGTNSATTLTTGGSGNSSGGSNGGGTATSTRNSGGTTSSAGTAQTGGKATQTSSSGGAAGGSGRGGAGTGGSRGGAGGASGGAGGSGGVTSATGGSTTTTTATSCSNGVKDGTESGVDCGGSCAACVTYTLGTPKIDDTVKNACEANGTGYICPRFMLFSPEMIQAAKDDAAANGWPGDAFNYGVATLDGEACCSCFQVVYDKPTYLKTTGITPPKSLVVQMFNTGAGGHVDVFMGKGGMGAFQDGCPKMYTTFPSTGENPWMGGIRASNISACGTEASALSSATCVSAIQGECSKIQSASAAVTTTTQTSCVRANSAESYYHENWTIRVRKVACPTHLTEVTGCKPNDDASLPKADPKVQTASQATGTGWQDKQSTSMQDCCKPSCSWGGKTSNMKAGWGAMYTCDQSGVPMTQ